MPQYPKYLTRYQKARLGKKRQGEDKQLNCCPPPEEMKFYKDGKLPRGRSAEIQRHISTCSYCDNEDPAVTQDGKKSYNNIKIVYSTCDW
ncbi:hypothetical protein HY227_02200 [Candidatus Wolfebacteria bacterium]|nr:hypothetical protein [Candidatus Wolfebacteria bacterium]